jgi:hypothetical protein
MPHEYDQQSTVFFWLLFMPCFVGLPTIYIVYVLVRVWRKQFMPTKGKQRNLAIYFFRLIVVFFVMWVPSLFLMFISPSFSSSWVGFIGGCWSHLQGAVSAFVSIMKHDIGKSFVEFVSCGKHTLKTSGRSSVGEGQVLINFKSLRFVPQQHDQIMCPSSENLDEAESTNAFQQEGRNEGEDVGVNDDRFDNEIPSSEQEQRQQEQGEEVEGVVQPENTTATASVTSTNSVTFTN